MSSQICILMLATIFFTSCRAMIDSCEYADSDELINKPREFILRDEAGNIHGPFSLQHHGVVMLNGEQYEMSICTVHEKNIPKERPNYDRDNPHQCPINERQESVTSESDRDVLIAELMKSCIIPELDFRNTNISDVIYQLVKLSIRHWPEDSLGQGVSATLSLDGDRSEISKPITRAGDCPFTEPFSDNTADHLDLNITFKATDISLYDAYQVICDLTGLRMTIRASRVMLIPSKDLNCQQPK